MAKKVLAICAPKGQQTLAGGEQSEPPVVSSEGKALKGRKNFLSPFQGFTQSNVNPGFALLTRGYYLNAPLGLR